MKDNQNGGNLNWVAMVRNMRSTALAGIMLALAGCASSKIAYYTLVPPQRAAQTASKVAAYDIDVLPVSVPTQVEQSQIVIQRSGGAATVQDLARWTGAPSDQIREAVSSELTARLGARDVSGMSVSNRAKVARVKIAVQRLEFWENDHVQLDATWQIIRGEKSGSVCGRTFDVHALPGNDKLVEAAQQALIQLAQSIAAGITKSGGC